MTDQANPIEFDWDDFIPDVPDLEGSLQGAIELIKQQGIEVAYRRWIGKSDPKPGSRTESIMVSCPRPDHPDRNPSAWLNSEKDLWYCGACGTGGDIIDLGAIHFGIEYRGQDPQSFVKLLEQMLTSLGIDPEEVRASNASGPPASSAANPAPQSTATPSATTVKAPADDPPPAPVDDDEPDEGAGADSPLGGLEQVELDWEGICDSSRGSFLYQWMDALSISTVPNEYLFWLGLQQIGLALGRDCFLKNETPVYANLLLALVGRTGIGKSRSVRFAQDVIHAAMPFDRNDPGSRGVQSMGRPASGEALYEMFSWQPDIARPHLGVRGLVEVDELSELMSAAKRKGSTLREAVIGVADNKNRIEHTSRSTGTIIVAEPFMAMVVGGQPDAMSRIMDSQDAVSGFANRFIFVEGTPKARHAWHAAPDIDMTGLPEKLARIKAWGGSHRMGGAGGAIEIAMGGAASMFDDILDWLDTVRERPHGDIFARLELHAMKLIPVLCANRHDSVADEEIIQQVHHLVETLVPAAERIAESISTTEAEWYQNKVLAKIEACKANGQIPPSKREITKSITGSRRNPTRIAEAITYLERIGMITKADTSHLAGSDKRRKVERWLIRE